MSDHPDTSRSGPPSLSQSFSLSSGHLVTALLSRGPIKRGILVAFHFGRRSFGPGISYACNYKHSWKGCEKLFSLFCARILIKARISSFTICVALPPELCQFLSLIAGNHWQPQWLKSLSSSHCPNMMCYLLWVNCLLLA